MNNSKLKSAIPAILFTMLVVFVLGVIAILPYDRTTTAANNTWGNIANGGLICAEEGTLYAVDQKGYLRCVTDSGTYLVDQSGDNICSYKNGVVYRTADGEARYALYNGQDKMTFAHGVRSLMVLGNWAFYSDTDDRLHKYWFKTGETFDIDITAKQFIVSGTALLYVAPDGYMYTARTDGSDVQPFLAEKTERFIRLESYIFYKADGVLYSVASANPAVKTTYFKVDDFNITKNGVLIYTDENGLHSFDTTEESAKPIDIQVENGVSGKGLFCNSDKVYYYDADGLPMYCLKDGSLQTKLFN